MRKKSLFLIII